LPPTDPRDELPHAHRVVGYTKVDAQCDKLAIDDRRQFIILSLIIIIIIINNTLTGGPPKYC